MNREYTSGVSPEQEPSDTISLPAHVADSGSLDRLVDTARAAASDNTLKAYAKDWAHFARWCRMKGAEARILVVENTADQHHLIICTLCSCYPRSILGQPPSWYISKAYRARSVREPRKVLAEFGLDLPTDMQLTVHDSNADMRYLVLPQMPQWAHSFGA